MLTRAALLAIQWITYMVVAARLQELWGYSGIAFEMPSLTAAGLGLAALLPLAFLLPSRIDRPSSGALWLLASFVVVPTIAVAVSHPGFFVEVKIAAVTTAIFGFLVVWALTSHRPRPFPKQAPLLSPNAYTGLVGAFALLAVATVFVGYGLDGFDLSFNDVYDRRLAARGAEAPYPGANYIFTWLKSPLAPLLLLIGIYWRHPYAIGIAFLGVLTLFSLTGEKVAFVVPLVALAAAWAARRRQQGGRAPLFGMSLTALIVLPVVIAWLYPPANLDYLVTRRLGLVPGTLTHTYVEYASEQGFTRFSQSWLRWFFEPGERASLGTRVGDWASSGSGLNANANIWAEGYASAGLAGVIVNSVLLALILILFDKMAASRDFTIATGLFVAVSFVYVNGYIHTSLLTGGVLLALLLVWLMPDPRWRGGKRARAETVDAVTSRTGVATSL